MTGPSPIFEGVGGYFKAVTRAPFELPKLGGAQQPYKILECSIKRFPLGQYSQTVVEAALQLRDKVASPQDIAEVRIETVTTAIRLMAGDPDKWQPRTRESADHSMPYTVAIALIYGEVEEKHFGEDYLRDAQVLEVAKRVRVKTSEEADRRMPEAMLCKMELVSTSGAVHTAIVDYHKGHWKNPMSDADIERKFRKLASQVLDHTRSARLLDALWRLDGLGDVAEVLRLTQAGPTG
jgi:2-methylcitrate dehydratase